MSSPSVGQLQFLNQVFAQVLREFRPASLAVLGCATGNGFEHIDPTVTRQVIGIDINPQYLEILHVRHGSSIGGLQLICSDIAECELKAGVLDLLHCALVLEYVDPRVVLQKAAQWLKPKGTLSVVLQLPSAGSSKVTNTCFRSLQSLEPIMQLVSPALLGTLAHQHHFRELASHTEVLPTGKEFFLGSYTLGDVEA